MGRGCKSYKGGSTDGFELLLVTLDKNDGTRATIELSGLRAQQAAVAKSMAATFNRRELQSPVGAWLVVARATFAQQIGLKSPQKRPRNKRRTA